MQRKSTLTGIVSFVHAQLAESRLPSISPEDLTIIIMYGSSTDVINTLMRFGSSSVNYRVEPYGWNALHFAIRRDSPRMVEVSVDMNAIICALTYLCVTLSSQILLKYGANPNQTTTNGSTPLLLACKYNSVAIVKV